MTDIIDYQILGGDMQMMEIELDPQEGVRAEVGGMLYMEKGITRNLLFQNKSTKEVIIN